MEVNENLIESLLARAEEYSKTSINLLKLKYVDKSADVVSTLHSYILFTIIICIFIITLTIATSLWIGELMGKNYYGFLIVSGFYGLVGVIFLFIRQQIKRRLKSNVINHLLN